MGSGVQNKKNVSFTRVYKIKIHILKIKSDSHELKFISYIKHRMNKNNQVFSSKSHQNGNGDQKQSESIVETNDR